MTTSAGETKLIHADDRKPGITRRKARHGWSYWDAKGERITDRDEIDRLNRIALPPAYVDAWFCPRPTGISRRPGSMRKGASNIATIPSFARIRTRRNMRAVPISVGLCPSCARGCKRT
jgi:DNA topoisomerase IB